MPVVHDDVDGVKAYGRIIGDASSDESAGAYRSGEGALVAVVLG